MSDSTEEDLRAPVLPGPGASDYERYLRTDELLSLQKPAEERVHHDELLFQTVHQSSELWLKFADDRGATRRRRISSADELAPAHPPAAPSRAVPPVRDHPARDAQPDVTVGVQRDPGRARARQRLRLAGLPAHPVR